MQGHHILAIEDEMVQGDTNCTMQIEADEVVSFQIKFSQVGRLRCAKLNEPDRAWVRGRHGLGVIGVPDSEGDD